KPFCGAGDSRWVRAGLGSFADAMRGLEAVAGSRRGIRVMGSSGWWCSSSPMALSMKLDDHSEVKTLKREIEGMKDERHTLPIPVLSNLSPKVSPSSQGSWPAPKRSQG